MRRQHNSFRFSMMQHGFDFRGGSYTGSGVHVDGCNKWICCSWTHAPISLVHIAMSCALQEVNLLQDSLRTSCVSSSSSGACYRMKTFTSCHVPELLHNCNEDGMKSQHVFSFQQSFSFIHPMIFFFDAGLRCMQTRRVGRRGSNVQGQ